MQSGLAAALLPDLSGAADRSGVAVVRLAGHPAVSAFVETIAAIHQRPPSDCPPDATQHIC